MRCSRLPSKIKLICAKISFPESYTVQKLLMFLSLPCVEVQYPKSGSNFYILILKFATLFV